MNNRLLGNIGEDIANSHLISNGYTIIQRNFRTKNGEIDIIARDGKYTAFIEVKARKSLAFGYPREAVTGFKQDRIKNMANLYIAKKKLNNTSIRFDIVEVILNNDDSPKSIVLIKNAF